MSERQCDTMKILPLALILIGMFLIGGFVFIWFGVFNVAATEQHSELTLWLISVVRDRSIAERATSPPKPSLKDPQRLKAGFRSYHTMCAVCHSVPGHKASPTRQGLNPKPPRLYTKQVQRRSDTELYWIIEHGIRMTGMPAFGSTHGPEEIWGLVEFIRQLPELSPQQYQAMVTAEGFQDEIIDADEHHED